jgi:transcription elongation factor GreB
LGTKGGSGLSKAFTRESDAPEEGPGEGDVPEDTDAGLAPGTKNYITPAGAERLRLEVRQLLDVERPEVVRTVSWAASNGDRSENGDYIYGKRRLREIDRRIRFLTQRLERAEIVDPAAQGAGSSGRVVFGATVSVRDEEGREREFQIVGIDEADVKAGKISWISPLAKALLGAKNGDVVTLRTPGGEQELEIIRLSYS